MVFVLANVAADVGLPATIRVADVLILQSEQLCTLGVSAHLVIVVHEVELVAVAVGGTTVPVVADIIKYIHLSDGTILTIHAATHRPVTAVAVDQKVMMPRAYLAINSRSKTMVLAVLIVFMAGNAKRFRDDTILERDVLRTTTRNGLVSTPGSGAVVDNGMIGARHTHSVASVLAIDTQTTLEADVTRNGIRADVNVRCLQADTLAWCRLPSNGGIGFDELRAKTHIDDAADVKDDGARTFHVDQSVEQGARIVVVLQIGDVIDHAATSANGITAIALSLRECQLAGTEAPYLTFHYAIVFVNLIDTPIVGVHRVEVVERIGL